MKVKSRGLRFSRRCNRSRRHSVRGSWSRRFWVEPLELRAMLSATTALSFDPDGALAGSGTLQVEAFDFLPSSVLNEDGNTAVRNFLEDQADDGMINASTPAGIADPVGYLQSRGLAHADVGTILLEGGGSFTPNTEGFEITAVLGVLQRITNVVVLNPATGQALTTTEVVADAGNYFEFYFDLANNADPLAGTGYNDGALIFAGTIDGDGDPLQPETNFLGNGTPSVGNLDQSSDGDNYPNVNSIGGLGSATLRGINVTFADPDFFSDPVERILSQSFQSDLKLQFFTTNPSNAFVFAAGGAAPSTTNSSGQDIIGNGVAGAGVGDVNGFLANPDLMLETDARIAWQVLNPGSIHGFKFHDLDADGVYEPPGEGPFDAPPVTFELWVDENGNDMVDELIDTFVDDTTTDDTGQFWFVELTVAQEGTRFVVREIDDPNDDIIPSTPLERAVTVNPGEELVWADGAAMLTAAQIAAGLVEVNVGTQLIWGNFQNATKSGVKFHDLDADGVQDAGEPGLANWTITLMGTDGMGNPVNVSVPTADGVTDDLDGNGAIDPIGFYWFEVKPGSYTVYETLQAGWIQSFPMAGAGIVVAPNGTLGYSITLTSGQNDTNNDFGNFLTGSIHGLKFHDLNADGERDEGEGGIGGVTFTLTGIDGMGNPIEPIEVTSATQQDVDADPNDGITAVGQFWFVDLKPGTYTVTETVPEGFESSTATVAEDLVVTSGQELVHAAGAAMLSEEEIELGKFETLVGATLEFGNFQPVVKSGRKFEDLQADGFTGDGVNDDSDPGLAGWEIRAYVDANNNDVLDQAEFDAGPALQTDGVTLATDITDDAGAYSFLLNPGDYIVVEVLQHGWVQTFPVDGISELAAGLNTGAIVLGAQGYAITLESGDEDTGNDFGNFQEVFEGCTPGFWKSNAANAARKPNKFGTEIGGVIWPLAWVETGVHPNDTLSSVGFSGFTVADGDDTTFRDALNQGGGGENALMRHAAAAFLNAAHPDITFAIGEPDGQGVVDAVNAALASGDAGEIEDLKNQLDEFNNAGCSLDQFGRSAEDVEASLVTKGGLLAAQAAANTTSAVATAIDTALDVPESDPTTLAPSLEALDIVFESVAESDDLLLTIQFHPDEEDDAAADFMSVADAETEYDLSAALGDLLSVA